MESSHNWVECRGVRTCSACGATSDEEICDAERPIATQYLMSAHAGVTPFNVTLWESFWNGWTASRQFNRDDDMNRAGLIFNPPLKLDIDQSVMQDALAPLAGFPFGEVETALDLGAHAGAVTCALAHHGIKVTAVEPCQIHRLHSNIVANGFEDLVTVIEGAVMPESYPLESVELRRAGNDAMVSPYYRRERSIEELSAPVVRVKDLPLADFVKVDVEGSEWALLRSGELDNLIRAAKYVDFELHPEGEFYPDGYTDGFDVPAWFASLGFERERSSNKQQLWKRKNI